MRGWAGVWTGHAEQLRWTPAASEQGGETESLEGLLLMVKTFWSLIVENPMVVVEP